MSREREADLHFIKRPNHWPRWPVLPVVFRDSKDLQTGLVFADKKPVVYLECNLFALNAVPGKTWDAKLKQFKTKEYPSFNELLDEWRID